MMVGRMRVSDYYKLAASQATLDFLDVDVVGDDPLFVDPRALRTLRTIWADECVALIQDFFGVVLGAIRAGEHEEAQFYLRHLREPNETHLGLSRGAAHGHALGPLSARDLWEALAGSEAIQSGLLEDLEETVLMIEGISFDKVSDIATNIIREPLIRFTQEQCARYGVPTERVDSGPLWDPDASEWRQELVDLPTPHGRKLLLVPKVIVRKKLHYSPDDYFNNYVLAFLMNEEIAAKSELVKLLKDGTPRVTKKALKAKYGKGKHVAVEITKRHPEILDFFRRTKGKQGPRALDHQELATEMVGHDDARLGRAPEGGQGRQAGPPGRRRLSPRDPAYALLPLRHRGPPHRPLARLEHPHARPPARRTRTRPQHQRTRLNIAPEPAIRTVPR
jgi:hypothetical protein